MTYKEKHLLAGGALLMALSFTGCKENNQQLSNEPQGLENPQPIDTVDIYGTPMTIYLTDIRTYKSAKGEYCGINVTTRGPKLDKDYIDRNNAPTHFVAASINGNPNKTFVEVYDDNVLVDNKGLAVVNGEVCLLDPRNWSSYHFENIEQQNHRLQEYLSWQRFYMPGIVTKKNKTVASENKDLLPTDTLSAPVASDVADSTKNDTAKIANVIADSLRQSSY